VTSLAALASAALVAGAALAPALAQQPGGGAAAPKADGKAAAAPKSPAAKKPEPTPLEMQPYKIRAWIDVAPGARLDERGREALLSGWQTMVRRFVGQPWELEVAEGAGPLLGGSLDELTPEDLAADAKGYDKAWAIRVGPQPGGFGFVLTGREWDSATGQIGLVRSRQATTSEDAPRMLLMLSLDMFSPTAEIGKKAGGGIMITVHGGMLPAANPVGQVVRVGSVFQATRVVYRPDGSVARIMPITRTYLRVARLEGPMQYCDIITKLRDPFTSLVLGRYKVVAVGLKPSAEATRLRFVTAPPENKPASGYTLLARPAPTGPSRVVGITDREGRVVLAPYFDDNLVMLRLTAADMEPLDEFPIMPGESGEERTVMVRPKREAVTLETELIALRDELIDQWSVRARLDALIKPRVETEMWQEVKLLLEEYDKLPKREAYTARLESLKTAAQAKQKEIKQPVLTATAQRILNETDALIARYIDDETFLSYADAYDRYAATAPPEMARKKSLPGGRAEDALAGLATPSASNADVEESRAGLSEFLPEGKGIRFSMPEAPKASESAEDASDGKVKVLTWRAEVPEKGNFEVSLNTHEKPIRGSTNVKKALDLGRARAMSANKGAKLIVERELKLLDRFDGREIEIEYRPTPDAVKHMTRVRTYLVGNIVYTVGVNGTEAEVRARRAELFLDSFRLTDPPPEEPKKDAEKGKGG
jgi:hypothetical protein